MTHDILYQPSYAMLSVQLQPGDTITAEAGAMVGMSSGLDIQTRLNASKASEGNSLGRLFSWLFALLIAFVRKAVANETLFVNDFQAGEQRAEVMLSPTLPGEIVHHQLDEHPICIQAGAYLANTPGTNINLKWMGLKGLLAREGLTYLRVWGEGELWFNAYGGIREIQVDGEVKVDSGHLVAFDENLAVRIKTVGGVRSTVFSGEGIVLSFSGQGRVWLQSRTLAGLVNWLNPILPK